VPLVYPTVFLGRGKVGDGSPAPALLLHFDGSNGSSTFTDSSKFERTVTRSSSGVFISTGQSVFGGASVLFDIIVSYLEVIGTNSDLALGAGDFTVDFWMRPDSVSSINTNILSYFRPSDFTAKLAILQQNNKIVVFSGATELIVQSNTLSAATWAHVALVRSSGTVTLYINGVSRGSASDSTTFVSAVDRPRIGKTGSNDTGLTGQFGGYLDELRIVIGTAVWTADFTPPAAPYAPFG
jgi:hypothetical protein